MKFLHLVFVFDLVKVRGHSGVFLDPLLMLEGYISSAVSTYSKR